ncbi:hypothetical protein D2Q93_11320 [Alicyclobacillaceae bacterium I2511]|nr:hypothetical protein D2Q93_11320 [Alicyclobacillaceae bacterium I2511]
MMWGYGGWGGPWLVFPILGVVMMVAMMYFMGRMMMDRNHGPHFREDTSDLMNEIRSLRREIDELKRDKNKEDS